MKKLMFGLSLVAVLVLSMVAFASPAAIPQANIVRIEAEDFPNVVNAEKVTWEWKIEPNALGERVNTTPYPFGSTLMKMMAADASLSGDVYLTAGTYQVLVYLNGPQGDQDAVYVTFNGQQVRFYSHGFNNREGIIPTFDVTVTEDGYYPVSFTCIEVGMEVDAIEFIKK